MILFSLLIACGPKGGRLYEVYDGDQHVLTFEEGPGPLFSTAAPPPNTPPREHPFIHGSAHSALHEHQLHQALTSASTASEFVANLEAQGLRVERKRAQR